MSGKSIALEVRKPGVKCDSKRKWDAFGSRDWVSPDQSSGPHSHSLTGP